MEDIAILIGAVFTGAATMLGATSLYRRRMSSVAVNHFEKANEAWENLARKYCERADELDAENRRLRAENQELKRRNENSAD